MSSSARFQLYYWPIPFRGCFVSHLFAFQDVPLLEESDPGEIQKLMGLNPGEQPVPSMGPPILRDLESGRTLSQMPAIVLYVAGELGLLPDDPHDVALGMKVLMDCNDVLMEICRYNGSSMWVAEDWTLFRCERFPHWLEIFEESLKRGFIGNEPVTFADICVFALFGNMMRCLPELEQDILAHAPGVHTLCHEIGAKPSLAAYVTGEEQQYGKLYCGGHIEASIRDMLARDAR